MSDEEYMKFISDYLNERDYSYDVDDESWMPAQSDAKEKMEKYKELLHSQINLTHTPKDQIKNFIYSYTDIEVGKFLVIIKNYHGEKTNKNINLTVDMVLYEKANKTLSGKPCNMLNKVNFKDSRFHSCMWLKYGGNVSGRLNNVPMNEAINVIKWLQVIHKMPSFI